MVETEHLSKAPIREALIDLRVQPELPAAKVFEKASNDFASIYPTQKPMHADEIGVYLKGEEAPETTLKHREVGYRFESSDGKDVAQFRIDGFTLSRLEPYRDWGSLCEEAKELWRIYRKYGKPESIVRVAVRYINVMRIPLPIGNLSDYLTAPPTVPKQLPQTLQSFLNRIIFDESSLNARCILTQALEGADGDRAAIILDIDAIQEGRYRPDSEEIWQRLEELRELKNKVFFSSITKRTVEIFR
jgi:uncharacterized protein (TIGR04255 family)